MTTQDDVNTSRVALIGFLGAILLLVIVVGLQAIYYEVVTDHQAADLVHAPATVAVAAAEQKARLSEYRMLDAKAGVVRIPIQRAMQLVLAETAKQEKAAEKKN